MSDFKPTENCRRFADLRGWHDRDYWQEVILRAGPHAYEMQYVCSIRVDGIHWSLAHSVLSARQCIDAILGNGIVGQFRFAPKLNRMVAGLLVAVLLEGRQTNLVTLLTPRWYESHAVTFRNGVRAHIETIDRRALCVRISRETENAPPPTFYVLARSTGELVDVYIVADSEVATWNGLESRTSPPPPAPGIAKSCEIEIPHVRTFLHRRSATAIEDRDPLDGRSDDPKAE